MNMKDSSQILISNFVLVFAIAFKSKNRINLKFSNSKHTPSEWFEEIDITEGTSGIVNSKEFSQKDITLTEKIAMPRYCPLGLKELHLNTDRSGDVLGKLVLGENEFIIDASNVKLLTKFIIGNFYSTLFKDFIENSKCIYDLIVGGFDFSGADIFDSLSLLSDDGYGLFPFLPGVLNQPLTDSWFDLVEEQGYFLNGIINFPPQLVHNIPLLEAASPMRFDTEMLSDHFYIVIISKKKNDMLFIGEADAKRIFIETLIINFNKMNNGKCLNSGYFIDRLGFYGFDRYKSMLNIKKSIDGLYDYKLYNVSAIEEETRKTHKIGVFESANNAIYLPLHQSNVYSDLKMFRFIDRKNYIQIILNEDIIINEYAAVFLSSPLGIELRDAFLGRYISFLSDDMIIIEMIGQLILPIPSLDQQKKIISAHDKVNTLLKKLSNFSDDISYKPNHILSILDDLDAMLLTVGDLTDKERVLSLIRNGEDRKCEFKESFEWCIRTKERRKELNMEVFKNISAFLNTDGGTLLIGVRDDGFIPGVENEVKKLHKGKQDNFKLYFNNKLKEIIGEEFFPHIKTDLIHIDEKSIYMIKCDSLKMSSETKGCFLKDSSFWVRSDPAKQELKGKKLVDYIDNHFVRSKEKV